MSLKSRLYPECNTGDSALHSYVASILMWKTTLTLAQTKKKKKIKRGIKGRVGEESKNRKSYVCLATFCPLESLDCTWFYWHGVAQYLLAPVASHVYNWSYNSKANGQSMTLREQRSATLANVNLVWHGDIEASTLERPPRRSLITAINSPVIITNYLREKEGILRTTRLWECSKDLSHPLRLNITYISWRKQSSIEIKSFKYYELTNKTK